MKTFGRDSFSIDRETVDLRYVEQLADSEQTSALAYLTRYALEQLTDGRKNLRQIAAELRKRIETKGWDGLTGSYVPCGLGEAESSGNICGAEPVQRLRRLRVICRPEFPVLKIPCGSI